MNQGEEVNISFSGDRQEVNHRVSTLSDDSIIKRSIHYNCHLPAMVCYFHVIQKALGLFALSLIRDGDSEGYECSGATK